MAHIAAALKVRLGTDGQTHLVGSSPAIPGCRPTDTTTLCRTETTSSYEQAVSEVECVRCLKASTRYWNMPSWNEEIYLT